MEQAIEYLQTSWKLGKSLKEVAHHFHVDGGNLARAFRNRRNMTVKEYMDWMRRQYITAAIMRDHPLGYQLADELGFPTDISFYRWVKRVFGVSFQELQRQMLGKDAFSQRRRMTRKRNKDG